MVIHHINFSIPCIGFTFTVTFFVVCYFQETFFTCMVFKEIESSWYSVFDLVGSFLEPVKILTAESWQHRWHFTECGFNQISIGMDFWFVTIQLRFLHSVENFKRVTIMFIVLQSGLHNFNLTLWITYKLTKTFYKHDFISLTFEPF